MASVISVGEVQQWLESTKLSITSVEVELEKTHREIVFARLRERYDVTDWLTEATTPNLVRKIISMMVASAIFRRTYSDDGDEGSYAFRLESSAWKLLGGVAGGSLDLGLDVLESSQPSFFPTDASTTLAEEEGINYEGASQRAFSMGHIF